MNSMDHAKKQGVGKKIFSLPLGAAVLASFLFSSILRTSFLCADEANISIPLYSPSERQMPRPLVMSRELIRC